MKNPILKSVKYWWISLLIGLLSIFLGIWCLVTPDKSLVAITYVFIAIFLLNGIFEIIFAISNRKILYGWGWSLASGIVEILLGLILLAIPQPVLTIMLIYLVGIWILFRSIWGIGQACELQVIGIRGWGWVLAMAIIGIIFSILFLFSPTIFKGVFVIALIAVALFIYGLLRIYLSIILRSIRKETKKFEN